jgi:hypothetical protein
VSFIKGLMSPARDNNPYERLGYTTNPFPRQGEVRADVFVERPELELLRKDLEAFLGGNAKSAVWALSGKQGLGKSNFLYHLENDLKELDAAGKLLRTAYRVLPSKSLTPARIAEEILTAIGQKRIEHLVKERCSVPSNFRNTDFGRFWKIGLAQNETLPDLLAEVHAEFLIRWIGGHQTYKEERSRYGIIAREKLPPAVALPYLRCLVDMLQAHQQLDRIILLLDEFEDVQRLKMAERTEYVQTLKGLLNTFNWQVLYVIIAGAPTAFDAISRAYPSLATRWRVAELQPVQDAEAAVTLATEYKKAAILPKEITLGKLPPNDHEIEKTFIELFKADPGNVTQRDLLTALHDQVDHLVNEESPPPAAPRRATFRRPKLR